MTSYDILRQETSALSSDGHSWLRVVVWLPPEDYTCRGVVQLLHGMAEHIDRYDAFARYLADVGYAVFGHDHIGHGKSVVDASELGALPLHGGKDILVGDVRAARKAAFGVTGDVSDLPLFLFGHSMGSYVARVFVARHGAGLTGAVFCGTGTVSRPAALAGRTLARVIGAVRGEGYRSRLVDSLVQGPFRSAIDDARTDFDWLSTNPAVVDAYLADPLCGEMFTVGGYATLTDVAAEACRPASAAAVPSDLPLLFVSGDEDPVGDNGAGVRAAAQGYEEAGSRDVECVLYPGMRHEILNEPGHLAVFSDVEEWLTKQVIRTDVARAQE